mmetsp:Transcript_20081/g.37594  ORF Transcript_20081/g.37594 Transcript_20081/m.37594 type:complete len:201 (+) Transcript_20081:72-674(+)
MLQQKGPRKIALWTMRCSGKMVTLPPQQQQQTQEKSEILPAIATASFRQRKALSTMLLGISATLGGKRSEGSAAISFGSGMVGLWLGVQTQECSAVKAHHAPVAAPAHVPPPASPLRLAAALMRDTVVKEVAAWPGPSQCHVLMGQMLESCHAHPTSPALLRLPTHIFPVARMDHSAVGQWQLSLAWQRRHLLFPALQVD